MVVQWRQRSTVYEKVWNTRHCFFDVLVAVAIVTSPYSQGIPLKVFIYFIFLNHLFHYLPTRQGRGKLSIYITYIYQGNSVAKLIWEIEISFEVLCLIHWENGARFLYPNAKQRNQKITFTFRCVLKKSSRMLTMSTQLFKSIILPLWWSWSSYSRVGSDACVFRLVLFLNYNVQSNFY